MHAFPDRRRHAGPPDTTPLRLLIVDDDPAYCAYLMLLARRQGYEAESAPDAETALELLAGGTFAVAVIDQQLPGMSGIELVRRVREEEHARTLYAFMLTAYGTIETKVAALNAGFDDFLVKGATDVEIAARLVAARRVAARQRTMDVALRELYGLATRDELTGVFNRRFFTAEAERLLAAGTPLNVILFDLDGFKQINDTHGHLAGDAVLREIGSLFLRLTRPEDVVARFGGDEFVMIVPEVPLPDATRIAARLRREVQALRWKSATGTEFAVGVSTGIASSRSIDRASLPAVLNAADRDMYGNKPHHRTPSRARHTDRDDARPRA